MRERGFTIGELMIALALILSISGIVAGVGRSMHQRERTTAAYAEDLRGLRRAVAALQDDLRKAASTKDLDYRLEDGALLRNGLPLMRNVAAFDLSHDGRLARVRLKLAARSDASTRREAALDFRVRMRGGRRRSR